VTEPHTNLPPYNIERKGEDQYFITMAVAGFSPDEIVRLIGRVRHEKTIGHQHLKSRNRTGQPYVGSQSRFASVRYPVLGG
jgi:molecular chaperone IbpA